MRKHVASAILFPVLLACAPASYASPALTPQQAALVEQTCDKVMGLKGAGEYRSLCQDSLSQSLARKIAAEQMAQSYDRCRERGLRESDLATCVLDQSGSDPEAPRQPITLAAAVAERPDVRSYFGLTPSEAWRQEQYSCAQLGLVPGTNAFQQCAAGLEGALFPDPN